MKITFKTLAIATSLCTALILSPVSFAGCEKLGGQSGMQGKSKGQSSENRLAKLTKKLGLSETQQADIKTLKSEEKIQKQTLYPAMQAFHAQVNTLTSAESFDEQAFIELHASNQDVFASKALIQAKSRFAMKNILTAEQLEKFRSMKHNKAGR